MPLLYNSLAAGLQSSPYPPATQSPLIAIEPTGSRNTGYIEIGTGVKVERQRKPWPRAESTNAGFFSLRILILHPHLFACPHPGFYVRLLLPDRLVTSEQEAISLPSSYVLPSLA